MLATPRVQRSPLEPADGLFGALVRSTGAASAAYGTNVVLSLPPLPPAPDEETDALSAFPATAAAWAAMQRAPGDPHSEFAGTVNIASFFSPAEPESTLMPVSVKARNVAAVGQHTAVRAMHSGAPIRDDHVVVVGGGNDVWAHAAQMAPKQNIARRSWESIIMDDTDALSTAGSDRADGMSAAPYLFEHGVVSFEQSYQWHHRHQLSTIRLSDSSDMLRHVELLLHGLPSSTFLFHAASLHFTPAPHVRVAGSSCLSLHRLLTEFCAHATRYKRLEALSELDSTSDSHGRLRAGAVRFGIAAAIQHLLQRYRAFMLGLAQGSPMRTIVRVALETRQIRSQLSELANICGCSATSVDVRSEWAMRQSSAHALSYLFEVTESAEDSTAPMHRFLLSRASVHYLEIVHRWVYAGQLEDPYAESGIDVDAAIDARSHTFWTTKYRDKGAQSWPVFLLQLRAQIIYCGKALILLRTFFTQHYLVDTSCLAPPLVLTFSLKGLDRVESRRAELIAAQIDQERVWNGRYDERRRREAELKTARHRRREAAILEARKTAELRRAKMEEVRIQRQRLFRAELEQQAAEQRQHAAKLREEDEKATQKAAQELGAEFLREPDRVRELKQKIAADMLEEHAKKMRALEARGGASVVESESPDVSSNQKVEKGGSGNDDSAKLVRVSQTVEAAGEHADWARGEDLNQGGEDTAVLVPDGSDSSLPVESALPTLTEPTRAVFSAALMDFVTPLVPQMVSGMAEGSERPLVAATPDIHSSVADGGKRAAPVASSSVLVFHDCRSAAVVREPPSPPLLMQLPSPPAAMPAASTTNLLTGTWMKPTPLEAR
jgi:flagellar biosynthesis GTPase FlhF